MAEIVGTLASSLQMAGLGVKFTTVGFKLHTLYREVQEAHAEVVAKLFYIQVITRLLDELNRAPMAADNLFRKTRGCCEICLQDLQATLRSWDTKMRSSHGLSRKFVCLDYIIHRNDVAKLAHRLDRYLGLLHIAIQTVMLASHERLE